MLSKNLIKSAPVYINDILFYASVISIYLRITLKNNINLILVMVLHLAMSDVTTFKFVYKQ